jgi:hypothetical protein
MIALIIYICDIIKQINTPLFMTLFLISIPICEVTSVNAFNYINLDWRHILAIVAGINFIIYIIIFFILVGSPMFSLNNEDYNNFVINLMKISKFNNNILQEEDFKFLKPYMSTNQRKEILLNFEINELKDNEIRLTSENIFENTNNNIEKEKIILDDMNINQNEKEEFLDDNLILDDIVLNKNTMKEEYLEDNNENDENKPYLSLFGELKMKDYSPFDLFKKTQIKNFSILSFLWLVCFLIQDGSSILWKNIPEFQDYYHFLAIIIFVEIIFYFITFVVFQKKFSSFHSFLVLMMLIIFLTLLGGLKLDTELSTSYIIAIGVIKVSIGSIYLLLNIITVLIYPLLVRTKGLGSNLMLAAIGETITFGLDFQKMNNVILYFMIFIFFAMVFSYGLPKKIGTVILQTVYVEPAGRTRAMTKVSTLDDSEIMSLEE